MKKVLLLAYDFQPYNSVGAQRPDAWFKYFKKYGFSPIVVTRHWNGVKYGAIDAHKDTSVKNTTIEYLENGIIIRTPHFSNLRDRLIEQQGILTILFRKALSYIFQLSQFLFLWSDSKNRIYKAAREYLKDNNVDLIIATGEPYVLFKYASLLSSEFNIPWHADYRDDWTENHTRVLRKSKLQSILLFIEKKIEQKYLSNVGSISSVSKDLTLNIAKRLNKTNFFILENGADVEIIDEVVYNQYPDEFLIVYTGIMYDFPYMESFVSGFALFFERCPHKDKVKVLFAGIDAYQNQAVEEAYKLRDRYPKNVEILKHLPLKEAILYQKKASVLLNLIAGDPSKGLIGAKCYIYAAVKKPILSIPFIKSKTTPFFMNRDIHTIAVSKEEVAQFLQNKYDLFENKSCLKTSITNQEIFQLSREYQTQQFISFLKKNYDL